MADPVYRFEASPSNGPGAMQAMLLDGAVGLTEGLWVPVQYCKSGSIEIQSGAASFSLQMYATNLVDPVNQQTITIGGTQTNGDVLTLTFTGPGINPNPPGQPSPGRASVSYTVGAGGSATISAAGLAAAINSAPWAPQAGAIATAAAGVITLTYPSFQPGDNESSPTSTGLMNAIGIAFSTTGAETAAFGVGSNGTAFGAAITQAGFLTVNLPYRNIKARLTSIATPGMGVNAAFQGSI